MLRAFFGHHKAATTWIRCFLHEAARALRLEIRTVHTPADWAGYGSLGEMVRAERPGLLVLTNARRADVATLPELRGFHVVRDPRDIVVSGYFSHKHSHPQVVDGTTWLELVPHRRALLELDHDDGMLREIEFSGMFLDNMADWDYHQPGVVEVRMEDLVADSAAAWSRVLTHLDLYAAAPVLGERLREAMVGWNLAPYRRSPRVHAALRRFLPRAPLRRMPASHLPVALERFSFTRLAGGRAPGEEDPTHHYRRGVPGDWRNHMTLAHLDAFRARYGDLVERLGYDW